MEQMWIEGIAFLVVAFLYASVGHGGASGYLALMALLNMSPLVMKPTALILNLIVSLVSFLSFYKARHFKSAMLWPLVVTSIPAAYLGSIIPVSEPLYKKILAIVLLIAVIRMLLKPPSADKISTPKWYWLSLAGAVIGLLSGMIGMGGGILLSPLLLMMGWANMQQTAAISAIFIFLNSASGMLGQLKKGFDLAPSMFIIIAFVLVGGWLGAYMGSSRFKTTELKFILALVLVLAVSKLLFVN
ncbi:sulfite exporter TauE/SafE family protein [Sediminibacterium sp. TEGAF015]|uniref:sulfite exporter TauE/SafE family protein n=1 Tax=Sediminibacterium sp. TEGAF015 TaxID=575378 RepID=UPI0021F9C4A0|nr:sulfite exporter TauE/SafE family protein [Sediminibacterium sp. TEGAF015]BDQ12001.1 UPF0721 transmembrane protein [Sediminibacterium sp. TEGAF015]